VIVVVTGGSGKAGRAIVRELVDHGHDVLSVDLNPPQEACSRVRIVDVRDFGQTFEALVGADAVVHLAAIPMPIFFTESDTFRTNVNSTFHVFEAARVLGLKRVVWASSETIFGLPFDDEQPKYAPIDEDHPSYPQSAYALSKLVGEEMGKQFARRSGIPFVALRFSNIMEPADYEEFPKIWDDPRARKWNLWGYIDARDVGQSVRLALEADLAGAEMFALAAADTVMNRASRELLAEVFPSTPVRGELAEFQSLLSIEKAKAMLGFAPRYSWRDHLASR
jgi:nucleoside-diphosphate-sugar epimerase